MGRIIKQDAPLLFTVDPVTNIVTHIDLETKSVTRGGKKVLLSGGVDEDGANPDNLTFIYDAETGLVTRGPIMVVKRVGHATLPLRNGHIFICGGQTTDDVLLASVEILNPATGQSRVVGNMAEPDAWHRALLLADDRVLIIGNTYTQIYNVTTNTSTLCVGRLQGIKGFTATLLYDGTVLVCGGKGVNNRPLVSTMIYDPAADSYTKGPRMVAPAVNHTATLLLSGDVFITGGNVFITGGNRTTQTYNALTKTFSKSEDMSHYRQYHSAVLLYNGKVFIDEDHEHGYDIYDPSTGTFEPREFMYANDNARELESVYQYSVCSYDLSLKVSYDTMGCIMLSTDPLIVGWKDKQ
jgi:hypothetical protein